jgi:hypothetical protein
MPRGRKPKQVEVVEAPTEEEEVKVDYYEKALSTRWNYCRPSLRVLLALSILAYVAVYLWSITK